MQNVKRTHRHAEEFAEALNTSGNRVRESIEQKESARGWRKREGAIGTNRLINRLFIFK